MYKDNINCTEKQQKIIAQTKREKQNTCTQRLADMINKNPALISLIKAFDLIPDERV